MDIDISFFSTSMMGFECIWTGVFTTLHMGMYYDHLFAPFGLNMMLLETIAASIFVTLSGPPEFCDVKTPISVCSSITILVPISWLAATLCAYNILLLRRPAPDAPLCVQCWVTLWPYLRYASRTCACTLSCGSPPFIPSSGSRTGRMSSKRTGAAQFLRSLRWRTPVLRVYPSSPAVIQLLRSLKTWRISSQEILISTSPCRRSRSRILGGDVSSPVRPVEITLSDSAAQRHRSTGGGRVGRTGRRMMKVTMRLATMPHPSTRVRSHRPRASRPRSTRRPVNRGFCHTPQFHWTRTSLFLWITGLSGYVLSALSDPRPGDL